MKTLLPIIFLFSFLSSAFIANGQTGKAKPALKFFEQKNRHGLKISLNSLINDEEDYIAIAYEYAKKDRQSYIFSFGIRGLSGNNLNIYTGGQEVIKIPKVANGCFFKASKRFYSSSMKPRHFDMKPNIFRGFYMETEFVVGLYKRNSVDYFNGFITPSFSSIVSSEPTIITENVFYQGAMLNFGRQGVLENVVLIDLNFGFGVAVDNLKRVDQEVRNYSDNFNHGVLNKTNGGLSFATSVSLKIGGIF